MNGEKFTDIGFTGVEGEVPHVHLGIHLLC